MILKYFLKEILKMVLKIFLKEILEMNFKNIFERKFFIHGNISTEKKYKKMGKSYI